MPSDYVKKLADEKGVSLEKAEKKWEEAKELAKEEGHEEDYGYITEIFKRLMGLKKSEESFEEIVDFKDFLRERRIEKQKNGED